MCSIAGIYSRDLQADGFRDRLEAMNSAQRHRGPDGATIWHDGPIGFGHTRLAIVGVSDGVQPSFTEDGSIAVIFNGEIYNHRALRAELERKGHRLRAASDTEVIGHLYEEYGADFVRRLDGDFAIALWDGKTESLLLTRDRAGVKPLYVSAEDGRIVFASEAKAIFASGLVEPAVDPQGLADCQFYGHTVAPHTFWAGVQEVRPGTTVTYVDGEKQDESTYFRPFDLGVTERTAHRGEEGLADYQRAFDEAVGKRIPDEVEWGIALSGGLDSSAIAGVAAARHGERPLTISVEVVDSHLDETSDSQLVASHLGVPNIEVPVTGERMSELAEEAVYHFESPFWYGIVATPILDLMDTARERGLKVMMSGDGSDETLAGYDFYRLLRLRRILQRLRLTRFEPWFWRRTLKWFGAPIGFESEVAAINETLDAVEAEFGHVPAWIYMWTALEQRMRGVSRTPLPAHSSLPRPTSTVGLHRQLSYEAYTRLPHWVLSISDRLGMARSMELRVPFLDRDVLDSAAQLHPSLMLHGNTEKYALKKAVRDVLPRRTTARRKKPFMTPIGSWYLVDENGPTELVRRHMSRARLEEVGLFEPDAVARLLADVARNDGSWAAVTAEWACLSILATQILVQQYVVERRFDFPAVRAESDIVTTPNEKIGADGAAAT
ncbi:MULTISPECIES: asparagine synthase (glutamine-hydrolyzing) [Tsukamurella]|uniref:asparagine synthase (glutamine-hydrolyzing) n=1 Tax=Tsukamurella strandjordii TaxID=147577 RepID=A0AA90NHR5_9ACTN|nr:MULTISPECIES: asparagine synthase (glutamine-hydrolyzing) [Tsukamurella]MDP0398576.1 asparagine synthase (glutamine-hydrolyzing) [Tsukamurella strandjordii]GIZ99630.1 asparagine synthetase B [Tsukamurella sp. TY48]